MAPVSNTNKTLLNLPDDIYLNRAISVNQLLEQLKENCFVSIIGEGGSGKSTLANRLLVDELKSGKIEGRAGNEWRVVTTVPFDNPLGNLADALCRPDDLFESGALDADQRFVVENQLRESASALTDLYQEAVAASQKSTARFTIEEKLREKSSALTDWHHEAVKGRKKAFNLLIIVDQLHELFRYNDFLKASKNPADDAHFINLLLNAHRSPAPIYVVIINDSRYFEYFAKYRGFPEAMNNYQFVAQKITANDVESYLRTFVPKSDVAISDTFQDAGFSNLISHFNANATAITTDLPEWKKKQQLLSDAFLAKFTAITESKVNVPEILHKLHQCISDVFISTLISDYRAMTESKDEKANDPFALQKLTLCLSFIVKKWRAANLEDSTRFFDPLATYRKMGGLASALSNLITTEVFTDAQFPPDQKKTVATLFKALTAKDGNNDFIRRPVRLKELQDLLQQPDKAPVTFENIHKKLAPFNLFNPILLRLPEQDKLTPNTIIDIQSDMMLSNWPELADWIETESMHAIVYRNIARDALQHYAPSDEKVAQLPANGTTTMASSATVVGRKLHGWYLDLLVFFFPESALAQQREGSAISQQSGYDGLSRNSLDSAKKWQEDCNANEAWAKRYPIIRPKLSKGQIDRLKKAFPDKDPSDLDLAKAFLTWSLENAQDELEVQKTQKIKAQKQRVKAFILAMVSVVACSLALFSWRSTYLQKRNIELIDFVQSLDYNGILDIRESNRFDTMRHIINSIAQSDTITDEPQVIKFLSNQHFIKIGAGTSYALSVRALVNIGDLYAELKKINLTKQNGSERRDAYRKMKAFKDLEDIYSKTQKLDQGTSFTQFPFLFYALYAHIYEADNGILNNVDAVTTAIEGSAFDANPVLKRSYAFGDKNGNLHIQNGPSRTSLLNAGGVVKSVSFSGNGQSLLVGTELGDIYRYDSINLPPGLSTEVKARLKTRLFKDREQKSIYFAKPWPSDPKLVLICNTYLAYFIAQESEGKPYLHYGPVDTLGLKRVGCREWFPQNNLFFVTGSGSTLIYRLNPYNRNMPLERIGRITHAGNTVISLAMKSEMVNGVTQYWLALGSETGNVWMAKDLPSFQGNFNVTDATRFQAFPLLHESSVTALEFNPKLPQFASASLDGTIRFWNLDQFGITTSDDVVLRKQGHGITAMAYLNEKELAVHQDLYDWVIKTNVHDLKEQLDCLLQENPDCSDEYNR